MLIPQSGRNISDHFRAHSAQKCSEIFAALRMTGFFNSLLGMGQNAV